MTTCDPIIYQFIETLNLRFRTHRSGVWQNYKIWEVEDPLSSDVWRKAKYGEYPDATNDVFIQADHTVTTTKDQNCQDLNLNSNNDVTRLQTGEFKVIISGTIGSFTGIAPGTPAIGTPVAGFITGTLEIIGTSREIISGTFGNSIGVYDQFDLIIDASGAILTSSIDLRVKNMTIKAGSITFSILRLSENCDIQTGAILQVGILEKTTSLAFEILVISGLLKLTGTASVTAKQIQTFGEVEFPIDSQNIGTNNGDPLANGFDDFTDLTTSGSPINMTRPIFVRGILKLIGVIDRQGFLLEYSPGSTLEYAGTILQTVTLQEWDNKNCPKNVIFNNSNGVDIDDQRFLGEVGFPERAETVKIKEGVVTIKPFEISPRIGTGNPASVWVDENNFAILDENDLVILTE